MTMAAVAAGKSFLDDPCSLRALVDMMPEPDRAEYKSYGALALESAFPGRKMVVYTLRGGVATDVEVLSFGEFTVDWALGPSFEVFDARGKTTVLTIPKRFRPRDLFLHVPQSFTLKYKGRTSEPTKVDFVSHYAVLIKTRSKEIHQVDGHTYCVTLNNFRERFPDLKLRY
jgi:hypothetical protein